ncbi:hypothetical protein DVH05_016546 [Phytophthora capsici]|nr:hypothetical protein DVH05_016546 [Phytophthora capsici]
MDHLPALESIPETQQRKLVGPEKSRAYRRQQKAMRKELLRQEASLRQELTALQLLKKEELAKVDATRPHCYLLWRDVAQRQRTERKMAQDRQQQLLSLLSNQTLYIKTIRDTVGERLGAAMALVRSPYRQNIACPTGPVNYAAYVQGLEASFQVTNNIFQAYDALFAGGPLSVHKQVTDGVVEYYSPRSRVTLPMSPLKAGDTLWRTSLQYNTKKEGYVRYEGNWDADNTLIENYLDPIVLESGTQVTVRQHFIARRFRFDNQVFMTWHFISEGNGDFSVLRADETGWCRLEPSSSPMEPGSVVEMCICRTLPSSSETKFAKSVANDFYRGLQRISRYTLDSVVTAAEATLLGNLLEEVEDM